MSDFERVERGYLVKLEAFKRKNPDFEDLSMIEFYARMDLTDDEIWWISYLEIENEDENMVWSGFPALTEDKKIILVVQRFDYLKTVIKKAQTETRL